MARTEIQVKNTAGSPKQLNDLVDGYLPTGATKTLSDANSYDKIISSKDLYTCIAAGDAVVVIDGVEQTQADSLIFMQGNTQTGKPLGVAVSEVESAIQVLESGYARRKKVIAIADNTAAPPTEVEGDRYILDFTAGTVNAAWDSASKGDIVQYDATGDLWKATTPQEGWIAYVDDVDKDALYVDDGTPAWELRNTAVTTHSALTLDDGTNPHGTTKSDVGLGNVDNTSDADKPVSTAQQTALDGKEDTFTKNTAFNKNFGTGAGTVSEGNHTHTAADITDFDTEVSNNTDVAANTTKRHDALTLNADAPTQDGANLTGQELQLTLATGTNHGLMDKADKSKLDGVADGAEVNVNADWNAASGDAQILNKPSSLPPSGGAGGDLTGTYPNPTISNNVVTNAKLAQVPTKTLKGRDTAGTGNVEDLSAAVATALLNLFTSSLKGLVPASGGGTTNFLRADGSWAVPSSTLSSFEATATTTISTTSISYTLATGMTLTPGAGNYIAFFSSSIQNNSGDERTFVSIFVNGVQQAHTEREFRTEPSIPNTPVPVATQCQVLSLGAGQAIDVRWRRTGGTSQMHERTLTLIKIG